MPSFLMSFLPRLKRGFIMSEIEYMQRALQLAEQGRHNVEPNPMVGAVIVKDNKIIGEGYHMRYGEAHAEINAFSNATADVSGATMYVSLEPCSHHGKTPPCADAIIAKQIKRVVVASIDPNPLVAGSGIQKLKDAGIEVEVGLLDDEQQELNKYFLHYIQHKRPFVIVKTAMTLNGKITSSKGSNVTSIESRTYMHELRSKVQAIIVGASTVIQDNPELTVRYVESIYQPMRVVLDPRGTVPTMATVYQTANEVPTRVYVNESVGDEYLNALKQLGVQIHRLKGEEHLDLEEVLADLGSLGIMSVMFEAGAKILASVLEQHVAQEWHMFLSPVIEEKTRYSTFHFTENHLQFELIHTNQFGPDSYMIYRPIEED